MKRSHAAAAAKSFQSCPTLCDPIDGSPPGSSVSGILQARTLEWVAISFSNAWKWKVKVKSCPILSYPMDCSLPGSSVHGIFQARILEWVAIYFSNAWEWKVKVKSLSHAQLLATPWTAAYQASPSMGFSRHEYWSGMPLPSPPIQYINAYIWNSERWQRWPYMRDSKRDRDVKNRLLDSVGEGEGGMIWEISIETCILSYVK